MLLGTRRCRSPSHQLRARIVHLVAQGALCACHLVETEPCGRFTYYRLRPEALENAAASLT
ncbi:hypothetical protein GCM10022247_05070 [Allokutzneria multivorans]|uniref:Uncharacterized protein n=1 Tax=Allokutzneria multivorans TaxID=1142134 RepID=A0ABP7QZ23_9PSEU